MLRTCGSESEVFLTTVSDSFFKSWLKQLILGHLAFTCRMSALYFIMLRGSLSSLGLTKQFTPKKGTDAKEGGKRLVEKGEDPSWPHEYSQYLFEEAQKLPCRWWRGQEEPQYFWLFQLLQKSGVDSNDNCGFGSGREEKQLLAQSPPWFGERLLLACLHAPWRVSPSWMWSFCVLLTDTCIPFVRVETR